jgi:biopolymer transport protein ExbB/TolQ
MEESALLIVSVVLAAYSAVMTILYLARGSDIKKAKLELSNSQGGKALLVEDLEDERDESKRLRMKISQLEIVVRDRTKELEDLRSKTPKRGPGGRFTKRS